MDPPKKISYHILATQNSVFEVKGKETVTWHGIFRTSINGFNNVVYLLILFQEMLNHNFILVKMSTATISRLIRAEKRTRQSASHKQEIVIKRELATSKNIENVHQFEYYFMNLFPTRYFDGFRWNIFGYQSAHGVIFFSLKSSLPQNL